MLDANCSHPPADLRQRMLRGVFWNIASAVSIQGATFLTNIVAANLLGKGFFGRYGMILSSLLTISAVAQVSSGLTATRFVAEFRTVDREKAGRILGFYTMSTSIFAVTATLLLIAFAPFISFRILHAPQLAIPFRISSGFLLFSVINGFQMGALAGLEDFKSMAKAGWVVFALQIVISFIFIRLWNLNGGLVALASSSFIRYLIFRRFLKAEIKRQEIRIDFRNFWKERSIFFEFAFPAAVNGFSTTVASWLALVFLARSPDGYSLLGLFQAAYSFRIMILFIPNQFNTVALSFLNNQKGEGSIEKYRKIFWSNLTVTFGVLFSGALLILLFGSRLLGLFGRDFREGSLLLPVLMLATVFEGLTMAVFQIVQTTGRMWLSLVVIVLPRDLILVLLSYFLSVTRGASGLALACACSQAWTLAATVCCAFWIGFVSEKKRKLDY